VAASFLKHFSARDVICVGSGRGAPPRHFNWPPHVSWIRCWIAPVSHQSTAGDGGSEFGPRSSRRLAAKRITAVRAPAQITEALNGPL